MLGSLKERVMPEERIEFEFDELPDAESAIDSVLGDNPRAIELHQLITALTQRRSAVLKEADKSNSAAERIKLEAKLAEMDMQIKVLREEEAITTFVENSVRATIRNPPSAHREDEDDE
jgi:hypothetical protein